jgi:hypothetical protein
VVAYKESRFRQFGDDGLPVFGPPNGFGIMQLDNSPAPTAREIWDWKQNVGSGVAKFQAGFGVVKQHYSNTIHAHPELRPLTDREIKIAAYQFYNSGSQDYYWVVDHQENDWQKNPNPTFTAYGDDAIRIEDMVSAGSPPLDWA